MSQKVNASDEKQVKDRDSKERMKRDESVEDVRFLLDRQQGRRFMWSLISYCGVYQETFSGSGNAEVTAFKEGTRKVGLKLIADIIDANPNAYLQMMKENNKGEEANV